MEKYEVAGKNKIMNPELEIITCTTDYDFSIAKKLTKDYMEWLGFDLCFQNIDKEFATFDKMYNQPIGCFIYAKYKGDLAGGVGIRFLEDEVCEMKRLYVYTDYQGLNIGLKLCEEIMSIAKTMAYKKMRLDTIAKLKKAIKLYEYLGFYEIDEYCENPDDTVKYMEIIL
jgi:ribosomal protein S18 acetylase RimI-like enzyme